MKRIPKAVWLPAVTLLYLAAWALILLIPSLGLPAVPADGWAEALEAHVAACARDGEFGAAFDDPASVTGSVREWYDGGGFRVVLGTVTTDRDTVPFQVLLRRLPFSGRYVCLPRYHGSGAPSARLSGVDWWLGTYDIDLQANGLAVTGLPRALPVFVAVHALVTAVWLWRRRAPKPAPA